MLQGAGIAVVSDNLCVVYPFVVNLFNKRKKIKALFRALWKFSELKATSKREIISTQSRKDVIVSFWHIFYILSLILLRSFSLVLCGGHKKLPRALVVYSYLFWGTETFVGKIQFTSFQYC